MYAHSALPSASASRPRPPEHRRVEQSSASGGRDRTSVSLTTTSTPRFLRAARAPRARRRGKHRRPHHVAHLPSPLRRRGTLRTRGVASCYFVCVGNL